MGHRTYLYDFQRVIITIFKKEVYQYFLKKTDDKTW